MRPAFSTTSSNAGRSSATIEIDSISSAGPPKSSGIWWQRLTGAFTFVERIGGIVLFAPFRLRLHTGRFREPNLLVLRSADDARRHDAYWEGADLVVEVLSEDDPERDKVTKRREYAEAGIPEYWIVDPADEEITVLHLKDGAYREQCRCDREGRAKSGILEGFVVEARAVFDV